MSDPICDGPLWHCDSWDDVKQSIGKDTRAGLTVSFDRTVTVDIGGTVFTLQSRKRLFNYSDIDAFLLSGVKAVPNADGYLTCFTGSTGKFDASFSDVYEAVDTELQYLDLRNDVVVTKEVTDVMTATDAFRKPNPGNKVNVFTGYATTGFHPVMFDTIPIEQTVVWNLYVKDIRTELHKENVHRGSDNTYLLMASFPTSAFGVRIMTDWAMDVDWYRQDLNHEADGDRLLFWAPWHRQCGQMNQVLDEFNRDLIAQYELYQQEITGTGQNPGLNSAYLFRGSVAFDADANMFYSISVPGTVMSTDPAYILKQKLVAGGVEVPIPTKEGADRWFPIAPL